MNEYSYIELGCLGPRLVPSPELALILPQHGSAVRDKVKMRGLCRKRVLLCAGGACVGRCSRGKGRERWSSRFGKRRLHPRFPNCLRFTSRNNRHLPYIPSAARHCRGRRSFSLPLRSSEFHVFSPRECKAVCRLIYQRARGSWPTGSCTSEGQILFVPEYSGKTRTSAGKRVHESGRFRRDTLPTWKDALEAMSRAQSVWMPEADFSNFEIPDNEMHFCLSSRP